MVWLGVMSNVICQIHKLSRDQERIVKGTISVKVLILLQRTC